MTKNILVLILYTTQSITSIRTCCVVPSIICFLLGLLLFHCCHLNNMTWQDYCQLFLKLLPVFIAAIWIKRQPMKILESGSRSIPKTFQSLASLIWLEIKSWDSASSQDQKSLSLSGMSTYIHILLLPTIFATYSMYCQWCPRERLGPLKDQEAFQTCKDPLKDPAGFVAFMILGYFWRAFLLDK